ncbi:Na+/H+ antiporter NhaA [Ferrimonas lipolytica]|uniref:Na(+)/H(+) antiporter NhaA n=1 Tax=Ferrimonas lipolytica TaxID=2724191 RepID=A0A6H1UFV5_9GAMM|nr:Na+/H+ antiporter NhaA [Ferrimonas lipolytica]QIZ77509.1 Na+/H+ antiporter NhaA [Ferrimonas lipolytica]
MPQRIKNFLGQPAAGGMILLAMVGLAMAMANSSMATWYQGFLDTPVQIRIGALDLDKPLLLWVNDLLMALFFLLIGLEVKRELLFGALSTWRQAALPTFAAIGGMVFPALIFLMIAGGDPIAANGWAIPAATDIAFALGILALVGSRVPPSLKVFLLALAIIDDLLAIVIIAVFYSGSLSTTSLVIAAVAISALIGLNRANVRTLTPYMLIGTVLWVAVLKSGVHATLAGVVLAFTIPSGHQANKPCPSDTLEHSLHPWSTFFILPLFAFVNAGVNLDGVGVNDLMAPLPLGIAAGLLLGKPLGILLFSTVAIRTNIARMPHGVNWTQLLGVGCLCGIGFTMAMFVASLAFEAGMVEYGAMARLGILIGSGVAAVIGFTLLRFAKPTVTNG